MKELEGLRKRISGNLTSLLGLHASVRLVEPGTIERSQGKAQRVVDKRKLK